MGEPLTTYDNLNEDILRKKQKNFWV